MNWRLFTASRILLSQPGKNSIESRNNYDTQVYAHNWKMSSGLPVVYLEMLENPSNERHEINLHMYQFEFKHTVLLFMRNSILFNLIRRK